MITWPVVGVLALAMLAGLGVYSMRMADRERAAKLADGRDARNVKFLSMENSREASASERVATAAIAIKNAGDPTMPLSELVGMLRDGHTPECNFCKCGHSEARLALSKASGLVHQRREYVEEKLRKEGWMSPEQVLAAVNAKKSKGAQ